MPSPEFSHRIDTLRDDFAAAQGIGTRFGFDFSEEDVLDLASGFVPDTVKAMCLAALDWHREDERRAASPQKPRRRR
jgi:hypothetical protein